MKETGLYVPFNIGDTLYQIIDNSDLPFPGERYSVNPFIVSKIIIDENDIKIYDKNNNMLYFDTAVFDNESDAIIEKDRLNRKERY